MSLKQKTYTLDEAKSTLEYYCAYQERCHQEIRKKLRTMNMIPESIDLIIVHLIEHDFLNETRFSKEFTRGKFNNKQWGKNRLKNELAKRAISSFNINKGLEEIEEEDYLAVFHQLAEKRWSALALETNPQKRKQKLVDYLLYRGWEHQLVYDKTFELSGGGQENNAE
ncbi:MAG: regulatory protein RecX [Flavobacteriaceae bacterium]